MKSRLENLRDHGKDAARIVIGCVIMLFIAGMIEGIFRQTVTSVPIRYAVAGTTAVWWLFYFLVVGRGREEADRIARGATP